MNQRILLIDLDNCPKALGRLFDIIEQYDLIIGAHGKQEPRVPLGLAAILGQLIQRRQMEIWSMPGGKNAADFALTYVAGRLSVQYEIGTRFEIASDDSDLDFAVSLLRRCGFAAKRASSPRPVEQSTTTITTKLTDERPENVKQHATRVDEVSTLAKVICRSLAGGGKRCRPKSKKSLRSLAQSRGSCRAEGLQALEELKAVGAISFDQQGRPQYDDIRIQTLQDTLPSKIRNRPPSTEPLRMPTQSKRLAPPAQDCGAHDPGHRESNQLRLF